VRKLAVGILIGLIAGAAGTWVFLGSRASEHAEHEEERKAESAVHRGTNGEISLKLDKETQERIGLKVAAVEPMRLPREMKAYGRVVDPAPLASVLVEQLSAQASLHASEKEYHRLKDLYGQNQNVSVRALESAEAAMRKDQVLLEAARAKLAMTLGPGVASQSNLQQFVESLVSLNRGLVRVDLPLGESLPGLPQAARLVATSAEDRPVAAQFLGRAPSADPQTQGQGFLFVMATNPVPPGSSLVAWLQLPGEAQTGVAIPRSALLRHHGQMFVYVQSDQENFQRREVDPNHPLENGWFIANGLSAGDMVVVAGAQQLLSEELKSQNAAEEEE
jgi:membrane fusion protein, multidrug efflux system